MIFEKVEMFESADLKISFFIKEMAIETIMLYIAYKETVFGINIIKKCFFHFKKDEFFA